jgi:hypothetical protein
MSTLVTRPGFNNRALPVTGANRIGRPTVKPTRLTRPDRQTLASDRSGFGQTAGLGPRQHYHAFYLVVPEHAPTPAQVPHVADYSAAQGDTFDFSAITSAFHSSGVSDALVVRAVEDASGKFATLQVDHIDPMGLPSAPNWVNVAQLDVAHAGDAVNVLIDSHSSVHLAQIHVDLPAQSARPE